MAASPCGTLAKKKRMTDRRQRLAELRAQVAQIDQKYASPPPAERPDAPDFHPTRYIEDWLCGQEVETRLGRHFETEKLYQAHRRHGSADIGALAFLVGVGRITREGFRVRQFFMRDYAEEASLLDSLGRHLAGFRVLITY